jgi:hypothetical protein
MNRALVASAVLFLAALAPSAHAEDAGASPDAAAFAHRTESPVWMAEIGYRGSFVTDPGMNAFSTKDYLAQFSLGASRKVLERGRFAFAPGLIWDYGGSSATARGAATSLAVHRLSIPLEARYRVTPWLFAFVRTAPGLASVSTRVEDTSAPAPLVKSDWVPTMDLSAGASWKFVRINDRIGFWLTGEAGYGWSKSTALNLTPDLASDDPRRVADTDLGRLALRGGFMRFGAALSF